VLIPFSSQSDIASLKGWLPVDAIVHEGRPGLRWMNLAGVKLTEPFMEQTLARARRMVPPPDERFTEYDAVIQLEKMLDSVAPTGFIFHSSRCGSTLVANACKSLKDTIVLSEPAAVDKLVARFITDVDNRVKESVYSVLLRSVVNCLAQRREGSERRLFLKFSCCSVVQLERIKRIWPEVPWLFIYRDPTEVVVSNLRNVPSWLEDSDARVLANIVGATPDEVSQLTLEELCARAIGSFYSTASRLANDNSMLLNYHEISTSALLRVLNFFGVDPNAEEIDSLESVSKFYSKDRLRSQVFVPDVQEKQDLASGPIHELTDKWCSREYFELERIRSTKLDSARSL
jgi:hypothetical protein